MYVLLIHTSDDAAVDSLSIEELQVCVDNRLHTVQGKSDGVSFPHH